MKKLLYVLLCLFYIFSLVGCAAATPSATVTLSGRPSQTATATADTTASGVASPTNTTAWSATSSPATTKPTPTPTPSATETPSILTSVPVSTPSSADMSLPLRGFTIGIDPGHQGKGNYDLEPCAPGSHIMKAKCSSGATGCVTGAKESVINLSVALKLKKLLTDNGATVVMIRETQDVNISNKERALIFNAHNVDLAIRLHCNGCDTPSVKGVLMILPAASPYLEDSYAAAESILSAVLDKTGAKYAGNLTYSEQTGFNWCTRPVTLIEMGFLSNPEEDKLLASDSYQDLLAQGICDGTLKYFKTKTKG